MSTHAQRLPVSLSTIALKNGSIAGIAGGLTIAALGMMTDAGLGIGFWSLPNAIGGLALGAEAGHVRTLGLVTVVGVLVHIALSAIFGVAVTGARTLAKDSLLMPIAMGLVLWVFNYYAVGAVSEAAHAVASLNPAWMGGGLHAIFGLVTGLVARRLSAAWGGGWV